MTDSNQVKYAIKVPFGENDWVFLTEQVASQDRGKGCDIQVKLFGSYQDAFDYSCMLFADKQSKVEIINYEKFKEELTGN